MAERSIGPRWIPARALVVLMTFSLAAALVVAGAPAPASAVGTVLFENIFNDRTVDGTGTVTLPTPASGANVACLTASGNTTTGPLLSCSGSGDAQGSGKLRLTNSTINQVGAIFGQGSFPTSNGLDVTFNSYQWGGGSADGIAFMLAAVDPANPVAPTSVGPSGGALGYTTGPGVNGLPNAYLGVGLDVFGNFSSNSYSGSGCSPPSTITTQTPGAVVVRGPGNLRAGYCGLATTWDGSAGSKLTLRAATRAASVVPVQVLINPTAAAFTSDSGVSVSAGTYKVVVTPVGQATKTLTASLPTVAAGLYPSSTWLSSAGVPKQLAFGFLGSTGSVTDVHEISNVKVLTFNPVPQLAVSTTSYSAAAPVAGAPVNYTVTASVLTGSNETQPISVSQTVPAGMVPLGAFGTGWVCQAPVGQSVTCTTTASSFTNGTALPPVTVVAIVTSSTMTSATVQSSSPSRASSADANPATSSTTIAGTVPGAPTGLGLNPTIGPIAGGTTVISSATTSALPTAILIGTAAELQAGTPVVLLPCTAGRAVGCFNNEGSSQAIASMPARATAATVSVVVVTLGVGGTSSFVYADKPATIVTPVATAGIASASVTWVAPASNGSAITSYVVTPYLGGVAQTPVSFDTSTTTRTFTGLTVGGSYAYTVSAVNAFGTSTASPKSNAVVAYALPGAPTITAATAGDSAATLTWTAGAANGSAISGYVVTPFIGATAQTPQTFAGTATTQTVTGLTPGTAYTFKVAAQNLAGTGPQSVASASVTPNVSPSLVFGPPPAGEVGVAYSQLLVVTNGTSPFVWSVSVGTLPPGLTLNPSTGLLSGTPAASGSSTFTVQVTDASSQSATRSVTLVIAAAPTLAFTPTPGEVGVGYSQQPVLSGGTAPITWAIAAGSLPGGITINAASGLLSGTPTASGTFSVTVAATDAFGVVASKTVALVIVARPAFGGATPPAGQVGVAYSATLDVTGGTLPLTWSIVTGSLPPGLSLAAATGVVSGTPTTVGSSSFTASVVDANGQTATKAVTLVIGAGPLVIVKTANVSSVVPGGTVAYTITVTNTGPTTWTGANLSDPLAGVVDDAVYNSNATATTGTVAYTTSTSTLGWTGNLPAGGSVTISYSITVNNPDLGNKILANTVTSTTLGTNCASGSADARCSAIVTVPGLSIVQTADVATTTPGSTVHFQIVVANTGPTPYSGAVVTESLTGMLDDAAYNADGTATSGNVTFTSPTLTWTGNLGVGASSTIIYSVTVANPDTGNRSLTGTVVSSSPGSPCPSGSPAPSCSASVTVLVPALSITTSPSVSTTTPGSTVGYTIQLANTGQTPYSATSVTIALDDVLDDATYSGNAVATAGTVVFNSGPSTLVWSGDLAVGAVVTVTASVVVRNPDPGDLMLTTVATSAAPGSSCPVGGSGSTCVSNVPVRIPALTITNAADVSTTTPGSTVRHTVSVTNTGQTPYTGATFSEPLAGMTDDATYAGDVFATTGSAAVTGPTATATLTWTGNLAIGASATVTFSVTVDQPDAGNKSITGTVTSTTAGSNCAASSVDPRCTSSVTVLVPGVSIVSSVGATTTTPGSIVHYSVAVTNTGQTTYNSLAVTLDLTGALDDATYNYDAAISTGNLVTNPDGTVDWVLTLAPGASATGTISVTVNAPPTGDRSLVITAVSNAAGSTCPAGAPAPSCASTVTVLVPGLVITKTADVSTVTPGGTVGYTITVANTGQTAYPAATFTDDLSQVLTDATLAGTPVATVGAVTVGGVGFSWTGALAPGASATITYAVTVLDPDPGDKQMLNPVVSSSVGSNCPTGSTDPRCAATVHVLVPGLTIASSADVLTTAPGATVSYTVTVTNSGATPYVGATFADSLTGVLDDADLNSGTAASSGSVGVSGSTLTWTGDLAVGASATVTFSVLVHAADGGDNLLRPVITSATTGNNCAVGSADPRCAGTVPVARLVLAYGPVDPTTTPGSVVPITATYTNTGQVPYVAISVATLAPDAADDVLPSGDQTASSGTLVLSATGITWTGDIPVGGIISLTATMTVQNPDLGDRSITITTESAAPGNNCPAASIDSRCSFHLTVLIPELTIAKVAGTTATVPGATVGYTITAHNTGQTPYTGATLVDSLTGVLDDASYGGDATTTVGTVTFAAPTGGPPTLTWSGNLAVGATATITYSVTVHSVATGDKTMVNPVSSTTVGSTCPPASGNAACHSTVVVLTPALALVKTADHTNATLGTTVAYTVTVTDSGQTSYASAAFTDALTGVHDDAAVNAGSVSATRGSAAYDTGTGVLSWSGALTPGQSATITYTVTVDNPDTGDGTMSNTVVSASAGNNCGAGVGDSRCTATVAITNSVSLTFTKTADVAAVAAGGVVHYTDTVVNSSTSDVTSADFTDPLAGILDDATYNNDAVASGGSVDTTAPNLVWTGTVLALSTITLTYSVTVANPDTGNQILVGTLSSTSLPGSNNCVAGSTDPRCTNTVTVAALLIEQHYTESSTTPGSLVHLVGTFTNTGQTPYIGITVSSPSAGTVDDAIPTGDQVATSGTLVLSATAITWTGNIPVGGVVTVTGTLTVKNPDPGNKVLAGTLVSAALGNNCPSGGTDSRCTVALAVLLPGLTISKAADTPYVLPGGDAHYTITIHNGGETPYVGATVTDSLSGVLDDADLGPVRTATVGSLSYTAPVLTWTGDLAVGATAVVSYVVTARSPATGDKTMLNPVESSVVGSTCPPASGNTACRSTVAVLTPGLAVTSAASVATTVPGAPVTYTLTATNVGQTPYTPATVTVALGGVLDDATYAGGVSATRGTVDLSGSTLTWTGLLFPGETVTITYTVTVDVVVTGDFRLEQTVISDDQGSTCGTTDGDPGCTTSVPIASLHIVNTADVATVQPTGVVTMTVTFTNTGQVPYVGISIGDSFVGSLDDASYNGDATADGGSLLLVPATGQVVWTGDLAVGATVTVSGSLTVNNPDQGDKTMTTRVATATSASNCPSGGTDPACTSVVTVLTPALTIAKAADTVSSAPGADVGYTITITNSGETTYTAATVSDSLNSVLTDASYTFDAATTATSGVVTYANSTLTWTGDLTLGQTVVVAYHVRVNSPDLGDKLMVNHAVSDALGSTCPTGGTDAGCTAVVVVLVPVLDIAVIADRTTTVPGGAVGYVVTIHNTGQTDYVGATVTAHLGAVLDDATYAGGATFTSGAVSFSAPDLTWVGDVAIGATVTVTYAVTVHDPDAGNHLLATLVASSAPGSTCTEASPCTNSVTVLIPGLDVSTSADVATATPGELVRFTITIVNTGQTPYVGTVVSTSLAGVLDDATFDGAISASTGVATYAEPDLSWTGSLPVGVTATVSYTVIVRNPDPGDRAMATTVVADEPGSTCPSGGTDLACTATVTVLIPELTIVKTSSGATTTPGEVVGYTITVVNTGQTAQVGAVLTDSLAGVLTDADYQGDVAVVGGGTLQYAGSTLTWTGTLAIGAAATITYSIRVHDPDTGDKQLTNTVVSSAPGSTCPPGTDSASCSAPVVVLLPALVITKTAAATTVVAGSAIDYTVTVANTGQTPYPAATFTDVLAGVPDAADYGGDAVADIGSVDYAGGTLGWTGALALGQTATVTFSITTHFPATSTLVLTNTATSSSVGSECLTGTDPRCTSVVTILVPALVLTKSASTSEVVAGGVVQYTITATNAGEADYPAATLSDSLAGVLDDGVYDGNAVASAGTLDYTAPSLQWTGALAPGATVVISYSVTADLSDTGDAVLTNAVVSATVGSTCLVGGSDPPCATSTTVAPRSITLSGLTSSFVLTGGPNTTVSTDGAVTMTVTTNSSAGYLVTVQASSEWLTGALPGNAETIPISALGVRESGSSSYVALSADHAVIVHQQSSASSAGGDAVSNDYQVRIPFVLPDSYSATLDYIASAQ